METLWSLWHIGNEQHNRGPYKNIEFHSQDRFNKSKAAFVMNVICDAANHLGLAELIHERPAFDASMIDLRSKISVSNASYHGTNKIYTVSYSTFYLDWKKHSNA